MVLYSLVLEDLKKEQIYQILKLYGIANMKNTTEKYLKKTGAKQNNTKTSGNLINQDMLTLLLEDFRAKIYLMREKWRVSKENEVGFGLKCTAFVGRLDLNTSSLKIAQLSLLEDLSKSYATFPRSGIMQNGNVYQTTRLDTHTKEKGFILLPTPTKSDHKATYQNWEALTRYFASGHQIRILDLLAQKGFTKSQRVELLEMVMGLDIGHTELEQ